MEQFTRRLRARFQPRRRLPRPVRPWKAPSGTESLSRSGPTRQGTNSVSRRSSVKLSNKANPVGLLTGLPNQKARPMTWGPRTEHCCPSPVSESSGAAETPSKRYGLKLPPALPLQWLKLPQTILSIGDGNSTTSSVARLSHLSRKHRSQTGTATDCTVVEHKCLIAKLLRSLTSL